MFFGATQQRKTATFILLSSKPEAPVELPMAKGTPWVGDFDGDGATEIAIGSRPRNAETAEYGHIELYRLTRGEAKRISTLTPEPTWHRLGYELVVGSVNGDRYDDLIVSMYTRAADQRSPLVGHVLVFYGTSGGLPAKPDVMLRDPDAGALINAEPRRRRRRAKGGFGHAMGPAFFGDSLHLARGPAGNRLDDIVVSEAESPASRPRRGRSAEVPMGSRCHRLRRSERRRTGRLIP